MVCLTPGSVDTKDCHHFKAVGGKVQTRREQTSEIISADHSTMVQIYGITFQVPQTHNPLQTYATSVTSEQMAAGKQAFT